MSDKRGEFAWVIEAGSTPQPDYWDGRHKDSWTKDHLEAIRFARYEDAERARLWLVEGGKLARSVEHGWSDALSPTPAEETAQHPYGCACMACFKARFQPVAEETAQEGQGVGHRRGSGPEGERPTLTVTREGCMGYAQAEADAGDPDCTTGQPAAAEGERGDDWKLIAEMLDSCGLGEHSSIATVQRRLRVDAGNAMRLLALCEAIRAASHVATGEPQPAPQDRKNLIGRIVSAVMDTYFASPKRAGWFEPCAAAVDKVLPAALASRERPSPARLDEIAREVEALRQPDPYGQSLATFYNAAIGDALAIIRRALDTAHSEGQ